MHIHTVKTFKPSHPNYALRATHTRPRPEAVLSRTDYRRIVAEMLG